MQLRNWTYDCDNSAILRIFEFILAKMVVDKYEITREWNLYIFSIGNEITSKNT